LTRLTDLFIYSAHRWKSGKVCRSQTLQLIEPPRQQRGEKVLYHWHQNINSWLAKRNITPDSFVKWIAVKGHPIVPAAQR